MESSQSQEAKALAENYAKLREEDAFDPRVKVMRDLFDLIAFYLLQGLLLLTIFLVLVTVGGPLAREQQWSGKATFVGILAIVLAAAVAIQIGLKSLSGQRHEKWLRRQARAFMPIIVAMTAFAGGWYWRHTNPPNPHEAYAERVAAQACIQLPVCVNLANRFNAGDDVRPHLRGAGSK